MTGRRHLAGLVRDNEPWNSENKGPIRNTTKSKFREIFNPEWSIYFANSTSTESTAHEQLKLCGPYERTLRKEIGFGNGEFLGWARLRGNQAVGIEVIEELNQRAKDAGFDTAPSIDALLIANASAYDLVAAFDVFEHIEPRALAANCLRGFPMAIAHSD